MKVNGWWITSQIYTYILYIMENKTCSKPPTRFIDGITWESHGHGELLSWVTSCQTGWSSKYPEIWQEIDIYFMFDQGRHQKNLIPKECVELCEVHMLFHASMEHVFSYLQLSLHVQWHWYPPNPHRQAVIQLNFIPSHNLCGPKAPYFATISSPSTGWLARSPA